MSSTDTELRIQMEGGMERIERAILTLEAARRSLATGSWGGPAVLEVARPDDALDEAVAGLEKRQQNSPQARALLTKLGKARRKVRTMLLKRLDHLGWHKPSAPLGELVAELGSHEPVVFEDKRGWRQHLKPWWGVPLALGLLLAIPGQGLAMPLGVLLIIASGAKLLRDMRVTPLTLTQRVLAVGAQATPLNEIVEVRMRVALFGTGSGVRAEMVVILRNRPSWRHTTGDEPSLLMGHLRSSGVSVYEQQPVFL